MPFLTLLISPIGRVVLIAVAIMALAIGAYLKIQSDAVEKHKARQQVLDMKRLQNALEADERARRMLADPDGLRANDGYRRD
jgi:hypothetical protein